MNIVLAIENSQIVGHGSLRRGQNFKIIVKAIDQWFSTLLGSGSTLKDVTHHGTRKQRNRRHQIPSVQDQRHTGKKHGGARLREM